MNDIIICVLALSGVLWHAHVITVSPWSRCQKHILFGLQACHIKKGLRKKNPRTCPANAWVLRRVHLSCMMNIWRRCPVLQALEQRSGGWDRLALNIDLIMSPHIWSQLPTFEAWHETRLLTDLRYFWNVHCSKMWRCAARSPEIYRNTLIAAHMRGLPTFYVLSTLSSWFAVSIQWSSNLVATQTLFQLSRLSLDKFLEATGARASASARCERRQIYILGFCMPP